MLKKNEDQDKASLAAFTAIIKDTQSKRNDSKKDTKIADLAIKKNFVGVSIPPTKHRPGIAVGAISAKGVCSEPRAIRTLNDIASKNKFKVKGKPIALDFTKSQIKLITTRHPCGPEKNDCQKYLKDQHINNVSSFVDYNSSNRSAATKLSKKIHSQAANKGTMDKLTDYNTFILNWNGEVSQVGKAATKYNRSNSMSPERTTSRDINKHDESIPKSSKIEGTTRGRSKKISDTRGRSKSVGGYRR